LVVRGDYWPRKAARKEGGAGSCPTELSSCSVCGPHYCSLSSRYASLTRGGSHKRRDKRCSIAAPLLRSALVTVLSKHSINVDHTGSSLVALDGPALEEVAGGEAEREVEVGKRIAAIEGVHGGEGGEVGIFNINHLGGHRYAGVMLVSLRF
jgi:hypothetical protein